METTIGRINLEQNIPKAQLLEERKLNLLKTVNREKHDYIPVLLNAGNGIVSYSKKTLKEVKDDPNALTEALMKIFEDLYCDCSHSIGLTNLILKDVLGENVQNFLGADGTTFEHVQKPFMKEDEYLPLIENPNKFVKEILLKRKYPDLFEGDINQAKNAIQKTIDEMIYSFIITHFQNNAALAERFGVTVVTGNDYFIHPLDIIFDYLRGFQGTILDLRRHKSQVKEATDLFWLTRSQRLEKLENTYPFATSFPHIPSYLNPKQFEEFIWPYMKEALENCSKNGGKFYFIAEGQWLKFADILMDAPKDSMIFHCDEDDPIAVSKAIGDRQIIAGGARLSQLKTGTLKDNLNYVKHILDECSNTNAYIFSTDRNLNCNGDITQNLFDIYQYVYENGIY